MKALIIYMSTHHMNTEKIAKAMAATLGARLAKPSEVSPAELAEYDLVGFGSGIYIWRHHEALLEYIDGLPQTSKNAFIFSTSGALLSIISDRAIKAKLKNKGFTLVGAFNCKGWDTVGPLKYIGGINRGRPNQKDIEKARRFAISLKKL